jgi:hypothetical protein
MTVGLGFYDPTKCKNKITVIYYLFVVFSYSTQVEYAGSDKGNCVAISKSNNCMSSFLFFPEPHLISAILLIRPLKLLITGNASPRYALDTILIYRLNLKPDEFYRER